MAAKREYKQRRDNPAILSAMKVSSCERGMPFGSSWGSGVCVCGGGGGQSLSSSSSVYLGNAAAV